MRTKLKMTTKTMTLWLASILICMTLILIACSANHKGEAIKAFDPSENIVDDPESNIQPTRDIFKPCLNPENVYTIGQSYEGEEVWLCSGVHTNPLGIEITGNNLVVRCYEDSTSSFIMDGANIEGFAGITISGDNNHVYDCTLRNYEKGIVVTGNNNIIYDNEVLLSGTGIQVSGDGNSIRTSTASGMTQGFVLLNGNNNEFSGNSAVGNYIGFYLFDDDETYDNNVIQNNIMNSNVMSGMLVINQDGIDILDNTVTGSGSGISIAGSVGITISGNDATANGVGLTIGNSGELTLSDNNICSNSRDVDCEDTLLFSSGDQCNAVTSSSCGQFYCAFDCSGNPGTYCGDNVCEGTETCSTCSADCGICQPQGQSCPYYDKKTGTWYPCPSE